MVQEGLAEDLPFIFLVHTQVGTAAVPKMQDVTEWTFPDGTVGIPQDQNVVRTYQLWMSED